MGQETKCTARIGGKERKGKALLETSEIISRPDEPDAKRARIPFASMKSEKVVGFSPTHTALKFVVPLNQR